MASALGPRWPLRPAPGGGGGGGGLLFVLLCASAGLPRSGQQVLRIGECRPRALPAPLRSAGAAGSRRRGLLAPGLSPSRLPRALRGCWLVPGRRDPRTSRGARRNPRGAAAPGLGAAGDAGRAAPPSPPRRPVGFLGGAFGRGAGRSPPRLLRCRALRGSAGDAPESLRRRAAAGRGEVGCGDPGGAGPGNGAGGRGWSGGRGPVPWPGRASR